MNNNTPGTSWSNPIWHRKWRIYVGHPEYGSHFAYEFVHDDFDGAPDSQDGRYGSAASIEECKAEIDAMEDDG